MLGLVDFVITMFCRFPVILSVNVLLTLIMVVFDSAAIFSVAPIIYFIQRDAAPDPITKHFVALLEGYFPEIDVALFVIIFLILNLTRSGFRVLLGYYTIKTKYTVIKDITISLVASIFYAKSTFLSSHRQGDFVNTLTRELTRVGDAFTALARIISPSLQAFAFLTIPFIVSWEVSTVGILTAAVLSTPVFLASKMGYRFGAQETKRHNDYTVGLVENLAQTKLISGFGRERQAIDNLSLLFDRLRTATIAANLYRTILPELYSPIGLIVVVVIFLTGRSLGVSLGEIVVLVYAFNEFVKTIGSMTSNAASLFSFFPAYEQVETFRRKAEAETAAVGTRPFIRLEKGLTFDDVSFSYPGRGEVLSHLSLTVEKGSVVAMVGESGSGKSTLIDLVLGLVEPTSGRILCDGVPLGEFAAASYRERLGYVPQKSELFHMSNRDNLLWAKSDATEDELVEACKTANAWEFISVLKDGLDTVTGDRGVQLSGGQVQRISLARAVLRRPDMLILDEATSSLDSRSESMIHDAIAKIASTTTVLVIAHRLSTIVNADKVYVMKSGRVIEHGRFENLISQGGEFARLAELQRF